MVVMTNSIASTQGSLREAISQLSYLRVIFCYRLTSGGRLPFYKGSMLRGQFGRAFKKVSCVNPSGVCEGCDVAGNCGYWKVFESPVPQESGRMVKYTAIPHPFIIRPLDEGRTEFVPETNLEFELTLFGEQTIGWLPYLVRAFEMMGQSGLGESHLPAVLEEVRTVGQTKPEGCVVFSKAKGLVDVPRPDFLSLNGEESKNKILTLNFHTPVRIQRNGKILSQFDFRTFFSTLLRRFTNMAYFQAGLEVQEDFRTLLASADDVHTEACSLRRFAWRRYSYRQEQGMDLDGMVGSISFADVPDDFLPLIRFGEILHVGKNTAFGCGKYLLVERIRN